MLICESYCNASFDCCRGIRHSSDDRYIGAEFFFKYFIVLPAAIDINNVPDFLNFE